MKANKAPEKIYMSPANVIYTGNRQDKRDIEFTRTDAFIKRACSWLENNLQGIVGGSIYIEDFKKAMKL